MRIHISWYSQNRYRPKFRIKRLLVSVTRSSHFTSTGPQTYYVTLRCFGNLPVLPIQHSLSHWFWNLGWLKISAHLHQADCARIFWDRSVLYSKVCLFVDRSFKGPKAKRQTADCHHEHLKRKDKQLIVTTNISSGVKMMTKSSSRKNWRFSN